jgi:phage repressor protein C with HTH and peptisase S24 domain
VEYCFVPRYRPRHGHVNDAPNEEGGSPGEIAFEAEWMQRSFGRMGKGFCLVEVEGSSMEPTFREGDLLLVDRMKPAIGPGGGLYAIRHGREVSVRRVIRLQSGAIQLISDNDAFPAETIERSQTSRLEVVGRVIWHASRRP